MKKYQIDKELLLEIRQGIINALYDEDGLDGADGTYLLSRINGILGFNINDHLEKDVSNNAQLKPKGIT